MTGLIALAVLGVAAHAYSVTPSADRVSAQDGGTATPAATAGELVVVPGVVQKGQTVLAVGFHVAPFDLEVAIRYSGHFTPEGESCDNAGTAGATQAAVAPTWVTLNACTAGDGYVRMVESATGNVIKDVSVTVIEPGVTGEQARVSVTISGLASTELTPGGSGAPFSVRATGLQAHREYNLHTVVLNNLSVAFNRGCTTFRESDSIVGQTSTTESYTVFGCVAPGNRIWSWVEDSGGRPLGSTNIQDNEVNVKDPTVNFKASSYSAEEGLRTTVTVELSHRSSYVISVPITIAEITDYDVEGLSRGRLIFNNHSTSESFTIRPKDDSDCDDETVDIKLVSLPATVIKGSRDEAELATEDDDVCVSFGPSSYTVDEGDSVTVEVELDEAPGRPLSIPVIASLGRGGTVSFGRSSTTGRFSYTAPQDDMNFDDEMVLLSFGTLPTGVEKGTPSTATINIRDDDEPNVPPTFDEGGRTTRSVAENTASGTDIGSPVSASDENDADTLTYSLSDADADAEAFTIDEETGQIKTSASLNFEDRNRYLVTAKVDDGNGGTDSIRVTINVTDVNESPDITVPDLPDYDENRTEAVATFVAVDPEGATIEWKLPDTNHATDRLDFRIDADGELTFVVTPDFESPHDSNRRNDYKVTIRASDGRLSTSVNVTVTVTNVNERPAVAPPVIPDQTITAGVSRIISLQGRFSDPDRNDTLSYSASSSNTAVATASVNDRDATLTLAALSTGSATITITAADRSAGHADRMTASQNFTVTVEPNAPAKVTGLTGMPGSVRGTIDLDWDPADRADDYEVEQRRQRFPALPFEHWVLLNTSEVTIDTANASAVVRGLVGGETYRHRVRGVRGTGSSRVEGPWSDELDTTLTLPAKVTGLTGMPGTNHGEIDLSWAATNDVKEYQLRQREHHNFPRPDNWDVLNPGEFVTDAEATVTGLDPEKTYVFQVRGTNVHGEGEWSDATPHIAVHDERPGKPIGLMAKNMIGGRGVELEWQAVAGAAGYEVDVDPTASSHQIKNNGSSVEITGLSPEQEYSFMVRAWKTYAGSPLHSLWSDPVDWEAPKPTGSGHQADHTVKYVMPTPIANSVVMGAIPTAVSTWNSEMARLGKGLEICSDPGCANPDGFTVTVKTVDNKNDALDNPEDSDDFDEGCGPSRACVKSLPNGDHRENLYMIFEDPPWYAEKLSPHSWRLKQYVWTKDLSKNGQPVPCLSTPNTCTMMTPRYYVYVNRIMLHEFGHTLGLSDFNLDMETDLDTLPKAVMHTGIVINGEDIEQLRAIYLLHTQH